MMFKKSILSISLLGLFCFALISPAYAVPQISRIKAGGVVFTLKGTGTDFQLLVSPASGMSGLSKNLTANVFSVKAPSRLVVDIPGFNVGASKKVLLANRYISKMRLGVHPDKTRLVLDIKSNLIPVYDIMADQSLGALVVSFSLSSPGVAVSPPVKIEPPTRTAPPAQPAKVFPKRVPSAATSLGATEVIVKNTIEKTMPVPAVEPDPVVQPNPVVQPVVKTQPPKVTSKPPKVISQPKMSNEEILAKMDPKNNKNAYVVKGNERVVTKPKVDYNPQALPPSMQKQQAAPAKAAASGETLVSGILFQAPKDAPLGALVVEGSSLSDYSVNQRGANLYELILKKAKLKGDHLTLPQFPPESFKGFEVVLANQVSTSVVVKIYVNDGVKLSPYLAQGKLWLKATN